MATVLDLLDDLKNLAGQQIKLLREQVNLARQSKPGGVHGGPGGQGGFAARIGFQSELGGLLTSMLPRPGQAVVNAAGNVWDTAKGQLDSIQHGRDLRAKVKATREEADTAKTASDVAAKAAAGKPVMHPLHAAAADAAKKAASTAEAADEASMALKAAGMLAAIPVLGEVIAGLTIGFVALKAVVYDIPAAIYSWTKSLLDSQRDAAQFSPGLAGVFLGVQAREQVRERAYGEQTTDSTTLLADQLNRFQDELVPMRVALTDISNTIGSNIMGVLMDVLTALNDLLPEKDIDDQTDFAKFVAAGKDLDEQRKAGKRRDLIYEAFDGR